jgi:bacteriocin biosynthesis cyclodehydratase domain-containing protein
MAPAAHLTTGLPVPVALLGRGPFGQRVVSLLSATIPSRQVDSQDGLDECFRAGTAAAVVALWRTDLALTRTADKLSFARMIPWLPIIMEHPRMRIGPLVSPGEGPCFRCFNMRLAQHDPQYKTAEAIEGAYNGNAGTGPQGYLPQHVRIVVAVAVRMLAAITPKHEAGTFAIPPGQVASISLVKKTITVDPVIACHNCRRCRAQGAPKLRRSGRRGLHPPIYSDSHAVDAATVELRT